MRPDKSATEANNTQVSDSELVDEKIYPLYLSQKAEKAVLEYEQIDWEAEQNQGQPEQSALTVVPNIAMRSLSTDGVNSISVLYGQ